MLDQLEEYTDLFLSDIGISDQYIIYLRLLFFLILLFILSCTTYLLTKKVFIKYLYKFFTNNSFDWDDKFVEKGAFDKLPNLAPAILAREMVPLIFADFEKWVPFVIKVTDAFLIIVSISILLAVVRATEKTLVHHPAFRNKPLSSYSQVVKILLYIMGFILVLSVLLGKSPIYFLSAFGAMTAILLLVFKDTILGLVASVQISVNDMVRIGDWVEMPKFNADGDVIDINLNTVKVQNWDKTITTIPTYYFITDSFKNWRGMQQSGGRRIKRSIHIDAHSVKLVNPELREKFKKTQLIKDYIEERQKEIENFNKENNIDTSTLINGRRMTNIGVFRKYIEAYLKSHPRIKQDMTVMVRQLASDNKGIPMEIYCFTNTIAWVEYESIQSDIFDHLYATAIYFELNIFQEPGGKDFAMAISKLSEEM